MKKGQTVILVIVAIAVVFMLFGFIRTATKSVAAPEIAQTFNSVVTASSTNATVTLSHDLYQDEITNVISVSSNDTDDTPAAQIYTAASKALLIDGLAESTTRQLVVTYGWDQGKDWTGFDTGTNLFPYLLIGIIAVGGLWTLYKTFWH